MRWANEGAVWTRLWKRLRRGSESNSVPYEQVESGGQDLDITGSPDRPTRYGLGLGVHISVDGSQGFRDQGELGKGSFQVLNDLRSDYGRRRKVVDILQRFVS
jgi:hypothetical protein